uniref:Si:ch73-269m23.5 n=1 Tax=Oryzias latipes TaxID=8090 RepID=A0A3B3H7B2_ORYLA
PGQSFQAWRLLKYLKSCMADDGDILLESYLQGWDQLLEYADTVTPFQGPPNRSRDLKESALQISQAQIPVSSSGSSAYRSVQSMVRAELKAGVVNFYHRTDSGCRTLLRLHRSLLWLKLMLEGLSEGPDSASNSAACLLRDAYMVALAPHHPWLLRQAAEVVFLALPDRQYFLQLVCVQKQEEAAPVLRIIIHALTQVHTRTQQILEEHGMLELP